MIKVFKNASSSNNLLDQIFSNVEKIERPESNIKIYYDLYKKAENDLVTDHLDIIYIHPDQWFDDVIEFISMFDYKSKSSSIILSHLDNDDILQELVVKSVSTTLKREEFSSIQEATDFFIKLKSESRLIIIGSISKCVKINFDSKNNYTVCNQVWLITYSDIEFDIQQKREIILGKLLDGENK